MRPSRSGSRTNASTSAEGKPVLVLRSCAVACFYSCMCVSFMGSGEDGRSTRRVACEPLLFFESPIACSSPILRSLCFIVFVLDYRNELHLRRYCSLGSLVYGSTLLGYFSYSVAFIITLNAAIDHSFCVVNSSFKRFLSAFSSPVSPVNCFVKPDAEKLVMLDFVKQLILCLCNSAINLVERFS